MREPADTAPPPALAAELAALCDAVPLALFHTDADGGCTHTNRAWQQLFGIPAPQSLGDGWLRALHGDDREPVRQAWAQAVRAGAVFEHGFRICRPDGDVRQVRLRAQPIAGAGPAGDPGRCGHMGVFEDLTEALQTERERRDAHALVARTGRMAGVGGWVLELATHRLSWTDEMNRLHEMPAGHRPGFDESLTYYPASARPVIERAIAQALHDGTPWDLELPFVTAAGRRRWVRSQGEAEFEAGAPVRLVGTIQDVSDRRAAEAAVREGQQLLRVLYEATPALLLSVDADGEILTVSDLWLDRLGYARADVVGRPATQFLLSAAGHEGPGPLRDVFRDGRVRNLPLRLRRADGGTLEVRLSAVADRDAGGRARRALIVLDDVSETMARSAELEQEQALRQQAQRHADELDRLLAERSQMLDVLAHEVRQPLNNASAAMQSAAAALAGRSEADVSARLARAQSVLGHVLAGVDNTLAAAALLAGNGPLARQETELDTLIGVTLADLVAADRGRVVVDIVTSARTVSIDLGLMRLALRNLLANALRHGGPGTPVRLRVLECEDPPAIAFEISDEGPGFEAALLPRLFERGARGRRGGHGLGLYIARRVLELHGGTISLVRSEPNGSTLRLQFDPRE